MKPLLQPFSISAAEDTPPPCGIAQCELATVHHVPISSSACDACRADTPHPIVAMACSSRDGTPFCISFSDSLANNQLAKITDLQRLLVFRWSEQQQRYARDIL